MKIKAVFEVIILLALSTTTMAAMYSVGYSQKLPYVSAGLQAARPLIQNISVETPGQIEKHAKFEVSFEVTTAAVNPYLPYAANAPAGVPAKAGVTVDIEFLPPTNSDWNNALTQPCFYYQPVEELGSGANAALLPVGAAEWRCRFAPEQVGTWQYRIKATDAGGTSYSSSSQFSVIDSNRRGFLRVSATDSRFFEFSNGEKFITPLVNLEEGNPFNTLTSIRQNIQKLGENGIRFVRWFPTGEGANCAIIPWGDQIISSWGFGTSWGAQVYQPDAGNRFSFTPYYYSCQSLPIVSGATYRLNARANVYGERVLRLEMSTTSGSVAKFDICSATSSYHEATGNRCDVKVNGWNTHSLAFTNSAKATGMTVCLRGLYTSSDAPSPFQSQQSGAVNIGHAELQRDETGAGGWGPNLLTRSYADTYDYVDQIGSARLDELFRVSEQYGVYHKLSLFEKNDEQLNRMQSDGTIGEWAQCSWGTCPNNFYSAPGQAVRWYRDAYTRYFVARWSYSPALHSLELANENDLSQESYNAGWDLATQVKSLSPRKIMMSNSFWGWFIGDFFANPVIDYGDQHWYSNQQGSSCDATGQNCEVISNVWNDSAAYQRECARKFASYRTSLSFNKPIARGEGGTALSGTEPQHAQIATEQEGVYYHKRLWSHVGTLGSTCDGDWYPRLFVSYNESQFPNSRYDLFKMFAAYEKFMAGEALNNGHYEEIGTDLSGDQRIVLSGGSLRAWGSRDKSTGAALLWVDNPLHTWKNVLDKASITPVSGVLTIQSMPQGTYDLAWWNTSTGTVYNTTTVTVGGDGQLRLNVNGLLKDTAAKIKLKSALAETISDWPQVQRDPQRTGYSPEVLGSNYRVAWTHPFQPEKIFPQVQAIIYQGKIYVGTEHGNMYALDARTGQQVWKYPVGAPLLASVAAYGNRVYFGSLNGSVYALNAATGSLVWKKDLMTRGGFSTAPLVADDKIMLGGRNGVFYAFDPANGNILWQYNARSPILQTAAWNNNKAFFGTMDMYVHAVNTTNGTQAWKSIKVPQLAFKDYWPVVHQGKVIVRPMGLPGELEPANKDYSDSSQQTALNRYDANPQSYRKSLFIFDENNGQEQPAVIHSDVNTMHGATTPFCVDRDGYLVGPIEKLTEPDSWKGGWGRLDLATRKIVEVISNGATGQGYGNTDENLNLTCTKNKVIVLHTQERNAHFTGVFDLDSKAWTDLDAAGSSLQMSTNTQGGGGNPGSVAGGMIYHISWHELIAREVQ